MINVRPAETGKDFKTAKQLFKEYAGSLGFDLDFQDFDAEMEGFPGKYVPPDGCILVAEHTGVIVGCVALRPLSDGVCEMKRLYVNPDYRGKQIGLRLAEAIVARGRALGYYAMRLDTVPWMKAAIALYISLGFKSIPPYCYNPIPGALYFELHLQASKPNNTKNLSE